MSISPRAVEEILSPDENAKGFISASVDPLRYDFHSYDPDEVSGIVSSMIPLGASVLDVGCGTGALGQILTEKCRAQVAGIEPDLSRAKLASDRGLSVHVGYFSESLVRKLGHFDIVLFADTLEHLPNPHEMLTLSHRALNPNGSVIVSVPNVAHWSVRVDLLRGKFQYQGWGIMDATHLRWFTADAIKSLLTSAGYKVVAYRATAGLTLRDNLERRPWRWLSPNLRSKILRSASKKWPTLFGCQHVIKASP